MRTELQATVEQKIGRNLLRYQLVELRLKQALPLRKVTFSVEGVQALDREMTIAKKLTLGQLLPGYIEALDVIPQESRGQFEAQLQAFADARNWMAHHLLSDFGILLTPQDCEACIARLDRDYEAAEGIARQVHDVHEFIVNSVKQFADDWASSAQGPAAMRDLARRQAEHLSAKYEGQELLVQLEVSPLEALQELMEGLETSHLREDGWVIFDGIGNAARKMYDGVPSGLLSIARQLKQYEFAQRQVRPGAGSVWMFRRL